MVDTALVLELRASAGGLRQQAVTLRGVSDELGRRMGTMTYAGPAADRLRVLVDEHRRRLMQGSTDLDRAADELLREATAREEEATW